jgi:hypothetical protein
MQLDVGEEVDDNTWSSRRRGGRQWRMELAATQSSGAGNSPADGAPQLQEARVGRTRRSQAARGVELYPL